MSSLSKILTIFVVVVIVLFLLGLGGFWYTPDSYPAHEEKTPELTFIELPGDIPRPVYDYLFTTVGDSIPVIETAVVWGTARFKLPGLLPIWMPVRWRAFYIPGSEFLREMEITWYGFSFLSGTDSYIDGTGKLVIGDDVTTGDQIDQGQVLALRGESAFMPSSFVLDKAITWREIDETTVTMIFPFNDSQDSLQIYFNPETKRIDTFTASRYKDTDEEKTLWRIECLEYGEFHSVSIPSKISVTWEDEGTPWSYFTIEGVEYNVDVSEFLDRN